MNRACISGLLTGVIGLGVTQAVGQQACRPALAFKEVRFSEVHRPTMERKWTAVVSVDASRCATTAGSFEIIFSRQKENGLESRIPGAVHVAVACGDGCGGFLG